MIDKTFLVAALEEAKKAELEDEVPVGAIIVKDQQIIARSYNQKEQYKDSTCHAEIEAIRQASKALNDWRLNGCTLYTTLEPCLMCAGAILHSRLDKVVFAAKDIKWGGAGSIVNLFELDGINHKTEAQYYPIEEASSILTSFFREKRKK